MKCSSVLTLLLNWFPTTKWFGFLKTGQAKETETLQESVLYKEVRLQMKFRVALVNLMSMNRCNHAKHFKKNNLF